MTVTDYQKIFVLDRMFFRTVYEKVPNSSNFPVMQQRVLFNLASSQLPTVTTSTIGTGLIETGLAIFNQENR